MVKEYRHHIHTATKPTVNLLTSLSVHPGEIKMLVRIISACRHFVCLRSGEFESRHFSFSEAIVEVYYEFFT
ncbi:hypothetical protein C7B77_09685 [Chamaesiphon polymorphus CCALA 037]|uniref:Uncharacterized protein n=1 Tax=Chamaesiphon polymorphus CCALA 037 TaxID=2107692 RepID=A0A2T1GH90_9CYAN|nr:hypothetical protein C7B77_09685 [Chamaesiphon polymorphus CCALA 037]